MVNPASRFLDEIPAQLVEWRRTEPDRSAPTTQSTWRRSNESAQAGLAARGMRTTPFKGWQDTPSISLDVGDRVSHDKYGLGTVVATDGVGPRATATIDFGTSGTIRLMLIGSVPLTKL